MVTWFTQNWPWPWEGVGSVWLYLQTLQMLAWVPLCTNFSKLILTCCRHKSTPKAVAQQHAQCVASWCLLTGTPVSFQLYCTLAVLPWCNVRGAVLLLQCSAGGLWRAHHSSCSKDFWPPKMLGAFWAKPVGCRQWRHSWPPAPRLSLGGCWDALTLLGLTLGCRYAPDSCFCLLAQSPTFWLCVLLLPLNPLASTCFSVPYHFTWSCLISDSILHCWLLGRAVPLIWLLGLKFFRWETWKMEGLVPLVLIAFVFSTSSGLMILTELKGANKKFN